MRSAMDLFDFDKSANLKHPIAHHMLFSALAHSWFLIYIYMIYKRWCATVVGIDYDDDNDDYDDDYDDCDDDEDDFPALPRANVWG